MLNFFTSLKYKLTNVKEESWHWQVVSTVFPRSAKGNVYAYYLFKLPVSVFVLGFVAFLYAGGVIVRAVWVAIAWFLGWDYKGNILDDSVSTERFYTNYKTRKNGDKKNVVPWEVAMVAAITLAVRSSVPWIQLNYLSVLTFFGLIAGAWLLMLIVKKFLKNPKVRTWVHKSASNYRNSLPKIVVIPKDSDKEEVHK